MKISTIIFWFFRNTCTFFIPVLILCACSKEPSSGRNNTAIIPPVMADTNLKSFLALGDSYTIGQSVEADQRFPFQTKLLLSTQGVQMKQPDYIAMTGWTTGNLLSSLASNSLSNNYDVVTLLIGVNNQYQQREKSEYRLHFAELLNKAIFYAGGRKSRVFVLSIPDYSVTPFAQYSDTARIAREIDEFNAINKEITTVAGVSYLDVTPISRQARSDAALIAVDGLHPSGKQYKAWATLLAPLIKSAL
jgi:lysophospholipase L1-like esterase